MNIDQTKREARREAWYSEGNDWNPFRRVRTNTLKPKGADRTNSQRLATINDPALLSNQQNGDGERRGSKLEEAQMTTVGGSGDEGQGRPSDPESGTTVGDRQSSRQVSNDPEKSGLFSRFHKKKAADLEGGAVEADDKPKKQPWYKGKELKHEPFTLRNQLQATIFGSWVNILLIAAPVGIALNYAGVDGKVVFVVNFIAIIPLAGMLSFATEEISLHVGESLGGLLNASFG